MLIRCINRGEIEFQIWASISFDRWVNESHPILFRSHACTFCFGRRNSEVVTQWWTIGFCFFDHFNCPFFLASFIDLQNWSSIEVIYPCSARCCLRVWVASSSAEFCIRVVRKPWNFRAISFSEFVLDPVLLSQYKIVLTAVNFPEQEILAIWLVKQASVSDRRVLGSSWRQAYISCNCFGSTIVSPVKKWQVCIGLTTGAPWATNTFDETWGRYNRYAFAHICVVDLQISTCRRSTLAGAVSLIECEVLTVISSTIGVCSFDA